MGCCLGALGASVTEDLDHLVEEVVQIEREQGLDPSVAAAVSGTPEATTAGLGARERWPVFVVAGALAPPPEPWTPGWVTPEGTLAAARSTIGEEVDLGSGGAD